eukprot:gene6549-7225_t
MMMTVGGVQQWFSFISFLCLVFLSHAAKKSTEPVTCGSVIKLQHKETGGNLHSHSINWGSGSGQQSVTAHKSSNDRSSLWLIKEAYGDHVCAIGTALKCGDMIRLEHVDTGRNLHSHLFRAPLSGQQEVSGFGENGNGDTGDNWQIQCDSRGEYWIRNEVISLMHVDTKKYLSTSSSHRFNTANCGGNCPIMDQTEISAAGRKDANARWYTDQGVYFPPKSVNGQGSGDDDDDDEL